MNRRIKIFNLVIIAFTVFFFGGCAEEIMLCPDGNHPHAIDLGLPDGTKWACCNVGAPSPESYGGYYAWGETQVKSIYDGSHYRHGELSSQIPQRQRNIAGTKYDVAHLRMGEAWQMPTSQQWEELINYCKWEWVTYKSNHGWMVAGPNGKKIFLPAGGGKGGDQWFRKDDHLYYWTSEYEASRGPYQFYSNGGCRETRSVDGDYKYDGLNIRSIRK